MDEDEQTIIDDKNGGVKWLEEQRCICNTCLVSEDDVGFPVVNGKEKR